MLPATWSWDMSPVDACGRVEQPGVRSIVTQMQTEPAGFITVCNRDETGEEVCHDDVIYYPVDVVDEDVVDATWWPDDLVVVPPRGGVTFLDIGAIDPAGNVSSGETCD